MLKPSLRGSSRTRKKKPPADRFQAGDLLRDRYRIVRLIGRGGMGEVYEAEDTVENRVVALKTVLAKLLGSQKVIARFRREIDLSNRISHPNVLTIYDVFELPPASDADIQVSSPCMVMELLSGETLADRLSEGRLFSEEEARSIVIQTAKALGAAHRADVVHRDLKPDNIFLVPQDDGEVRVVMTDFGVARPNNQPDTEESFTATDVIVGTPLYMAPEQLELEEALPESDLYTLGLVVYEMLTGKFPFEGDTGIQVVFMRVQEDPIPPSRFKPDISEKWEELILSCLERDPNNRIREADDIVAFLEGDEELGSRKKWQPSWWPLK